MIVDALAEPLDWAGKASRCAVPKQFWKRYIRPDQTPTHESENGEPLDGGRRIQLWAGFRSERVLRPSGAQWALLAATMSRVSLLSATSSEGEPFVTVSVWLTAAGDLRLAETSRSASASPAAASAPAAAVDARPLAKQPRTAGRFSSSLAPESAADPHMQVTFELHEFSAELVCVEDHGVLLRRAYSYIHALAMYLDKTLPESCSSWTLSDVFEIINTSSSTTSDETPAWDTVRIGERHVWSAFRNKCLPPGVCRPGLGVMLRLLHVQRAAWTLSCVRGGRS